MDTQRTSLGREAAIALYDTKWWEGRRAHDICQIQLFTKELVCPFGVFHEVVEKALGRPAWTHEFGLNYDGIVAEFLGEKLPPTMEEIIELIPEEKRIVLPIKTNSP